MTASIGKPPRRAGILHRLPPAVWPVLAAAGAAAAATMVHFVDPNEQGNYPTCPWLWITGTYCPGCGSMRAVAALTNLDLMGAVQMNALLLVLLPALAWSWGSWFYQSLRPSKVPLTTLRLKPRWIWMFLGVLIAFAVIRNLPFGVFLAPGGIPAAEFLG